MMKTTKSNINHKSEDENEFKNSIKNTPTKQSKSQLGTYKSKYAIQRMSCSNFAMYEKFLNAASEKMCEKTTKVFETYDLVFSRHMSELQESRKNIRLNIHSIFLTMKNRHITELTDLEISHAFERQKAIQHPCVQENQLIKQAQRLARIHNLEEAFTLRDKAKEVRSSEKEKRELIVAQKYQLMFQRLENKQKNELNELQNQFVLSVKNAQLIYDRLILNLQKKTVSNVKNILNQGIAQCRKDVKDQSQNHKIAQKLTEVMNKKIYDDGRVNLFLAVQK